MVDSLIDRIWLLTPADLDTQRAWIAAGIERIGADRLQTLATMAAAARLNAYAPYSNFKVGAAVLCKSGNMYASPNVEVVSYSETDHAEQATVTKAVSEGEVQRSGRRFLEAMAISGTGGSGPCGRCRQKLQEHGDNVLMVKADAEGSILWVTSLAMYLPRPFNPTILGIE